MSKILAMLVLCGTVGCGERDTSCAAVMKHLEAITPVEARSEAFRGRRGRMMRNCTKDTTEADRICLLNSNDMYEALECAPK
jgi:hypothetical protein